MNKQSIICFIAFTVFVDVNAIAQSPATGSVNGHDYVDLGLSVKWATCNIGASSPSDYGDFFAWGEAETKSEYTKENSVTYGKSNYTFLDAASIRWNSAWRMPTESECQELIDNCTWKWKKIGDHKGYLVTSKKNGNSIFLPAAGYCNGSLTGYYGFYSSSQPSRRDIEYAIGINFNGKSLCGVYLQQREVGCSIRPVTK